MNRRAWFGALLLLVAALGWVGYRSLLPDSDRMLDQAADALDAGDYEQARDLAQRSVHWLSSSADHDRAALIIGQSYLRDPRTRDSSGVVAAMLHLGKIPMDSPVQPACSETIADYRLFVLKRPSDADELIRDALELHPNSPRLNKWMIQRWAMTNRAPLAESFLEQALLGTADFEEWAALLRVWLLSQWALERLEIQFDREFGVAGEQELVTDAIRLERWTTLRRRYLDDPVVYGAMARWHLKRGHLELAMECLQEGQHHAERNPEASFLLVLIEAFCQAKEVEQARRLLEPLQTLGNPFTHHSGQAHVALASDDLLQAQQALEMAYQHWPGPIDTWVSETLEKIYRQSDTAAASEQADRLKTHRVWVESQRSQIADAAESLESLESRQFLQTVLQRLNRTAELEILDRMGRHDTTNR